jgi:hypothetical protein
VVWNTAETLSGARVDLVSAVNLVRLAQYRDGVLSQRERRVNSGGLLVERNVMPP